MSASEADEPFTQGRDFYSVRTIKNGENFSIGYLGTYTDRPVLDRNADVHSIDAIYRPNNKLRFETIYLTSNVDQGIDNTETSGDIFRFRLTASPEKGRWHDFGIFFFDEDTDISDMGYQMNNNMLWAGGQNGLKFTDFDESSLLLSTEYEYGFGYEANADMDKSAIFASLTYKSTFKNTSFMEFANFHRSASKDYWITRGNVNAPFVKKPENYGTMLQYKGPSKDFFNYFIEVKREKGTTWGFSALGFNTAYTAQIDLSPRDKEKKQRTTIVSLNWFGGDKHELRMKAQMVAFTARNPRAYLGDVYGALNPLEMDLPPFTLSDLAFQIRYRYEILPLAYLYVVYSKGGRIVEYDEEDNLGEIYKRPWNDPQADTFTVKVRYRF